MSMRVLQWGLLVAMVVGIAGAAPLVAGPTAAGAADVAAGAATRISGEEAIARALNDVSPADDGFVVRHPRHEVRFSGDGVHFRPRNGGPEWHWRLDVASVGATIGPVRPLRRKTEIVYRRGALTERYLLGPESIEQQFLLAAGPALDGRDLVIAGRVESAGGFRTTSDGWLWQSRRGGVRLGDVTVFDVRGKKLPAQMAVTRTGTRIVVPASALAAATYPVTIDPEIGANDFRISDVGPPDAIADAFQPAVAYNPIENEYLVVWAGDENSGGLAEEELEIFGQRLNASTGAPVGPNDFRISDMGPDGNAAFDALNPATAYNRTSGEYLVVWEGDDNTAPLVNDEFEIYGQRLDAATGLQVGTNDFRISDMGPDGNGSFDAVNPAVAHDPANNQYLVVWQGDDNTAPLVDQEFEIFGQRLTVLGGLAGANDFRISDMGPDGNPGFGALRPAVAHNPTDNQYLVVWQGDDNTAPLVQDEFEIFGQRLNAIAGSAGANDFRISGMGPDGNPSFIAGDPAVAHNSTSNEYLVVWAADDDTAPLVDNEFEIFAQRLTGVGTAVGADDFRVSDMGPDGSPGFAAFFPSVAYNTTLDEYVVVWEGDDNTAPLVDNEREIFGQRLGPTGAEVGPEFRFSAMGPNGNASFGAFLPAVVHNATNNAYLVVWRGDDNTPPLVDGEFEIFGRQLVFSGRLGLLSDDFRISDMGPPDTAGDAFAPAVAYNATSNEYLVVWVGDEGTAPLADDEREIFGQRLDAATGAEMGANDFRISDMGPDGNANFSAADPAVAHSPTNNEYLVVWEGDDNTGALVDDEREIFGQRLSASGGVVGTNDFRISDNIGPDGNASFDAIDPAVAYNAIDNQYLVVWAADDDTGTRLDEEFEIVGQRINAATGGQLGTNDLHISDVGPNGTADFDAFTPAVAHNTADNEYLVVWRGDDDAGPLVDDEFEIFGQRLTATGSKLGTNDFPISSMGPSGNTSFSASNPAVAYNPTGNQYLVVWDGDDNTGSLVNDEREIFGQRLTAFGSEIGFANDFRISGMGGSGNATFDAFNPAIAYNATDNEYLVVWQGDDNTAPLVENEFEIFGRRLNAATGATLQNDFRLSDMGPNGNDFFAAQQAAAAYDAADNEYLVVWEGDDDTPPLVNQEFEIFGQRFGPVGGNVGSFTLAPPAATVARHQPVMFELVWTHPGVWRDLATIDLRIVGSGGEPLTWLRWEEAPNTFSIFRAGQFRHPLPPGGNGRHETPWASLPLADTAVIGSGPTGQSVTLRLPISFKPKAAGGSYRIEVAATDDLGNTQDFELAGTVTVTR